MTPATTPVLDINPDQAKSVGREIEATTASLALRVGQTIAITDSVSLQQAVEDRLQIGEAIKRVETFFEPFKGMAYKLWKSLCARENEILAPLQAVDGELRQAMSTYKTQQDRLRLEREQAIAEARRREEQARALAEAAALEDAQQPEMAAMVVAEAIAAPMPVVVLPDEVKATGAKFRREWKWKFTTTEARAQQLIPREYLVVDTKKINAVVKAMKGSTNIPGISVYSEDVPVR